MILLIEPTLIFFGKDNISTNASSGNSGFIQTCVINGLPFLSQHVFPLIFEPSFPDSAILPSVAPTTLTQ